MKTLRLRPYLSAFRVRALLETQYRGAALGGLVTQVFFALVYIALYHALYASGGAQETPLEEVVTYVWLQQMAFRALLSADGELNERVLSGGIAYDLCRPVDPLGMVVQPGGGPEAGGHAHARRAHGAFAVPDACRLPDGLALLLGGGDGFYGVPGGRFGGDCRGGRHTLGGGDADPGFNRYTYSSC